LIDEIAKVPGKAEADGKATPLRDVGSGTVHINPAEN
jgi:hypothetical protein